MSLTPDMMPSWELREHLAQREAEITRLRGEVERLRAMVQKSYNDGFSEGMKEFTTHRGGKPWALSKWPAALGDTHE